MIVEINAVEHVFEGVTDNEKTMKRLQIVEAKPTRATPLGPNVTSLNSTPEPSLTTSRPPAAASGAISLGETGQFTDAPIATMMTAG
ncbi:hypothetical protein OS493_020497 [Desmophyllum pertusum]|uniref:Uncharacterized protein n=1 Tax=Desmophyllum pertusum TaxID=174260 RepID=A0A9X0CS08_9CNID|nr:hypothetical protein OS493_020497 [Desmophyllum pertusum]